MISPNHPLFVTTTENNWQQGFRATNQSFKSRVDMTITKMLRGIERC